MRPTTLRSPGVVSCPVTVVSQHRAVAVADLETVSSEFSSHSLTSRVRVTLCGHGFGDREEAFGADENVLEAVAAALGMQPKDVQLSGESIGDVTFRDAGVESMATITVRGCEPELLAEVSLAEDRLVNCSTH